MGLCICAKGLDKDKEFRFSYGTFYQMRLDILKLYNPKLRELYNTISWYYMRCQKPQQYLFDRWDEIGNPDLDILIWHSDCDGKLTPTECRKIYAVIKDMHSDYKIGGVNILERFKECLMYSIKRRVILRFC